jgi:hypothetical protein
MSIAGPVLLHVTLHRVRRWVRIADGDYRPARAHFGLRWLPGVAFAETLEAWKTSVRAGISRPELAVAQVRQRRLLASLDDQERIRFAIGALGALDGRASVHERRFWLAERGHPVATDALEQALGATSAGSTTVTRAEQPPAVEGPPRGEVSRGDSPGAPALPAPPRSRAARSSRSRRSRGDKRPGGTPKSQQAREFVLGEWAQGRQVTGGEIDRRFQVSEGYGRRLLRDLAATTNGQHSPTTSATASEEGQS